MLAARELDQSRLPQDAQTWINQHFKFTHGIGLAMSPVNRFDSEGLPIFYVKDIPPVSPAGLRIDRPECTSARRPPTTSSSAATPRSSTTRRARTTCTPRTTGRDGVALDSLWRRLLFAWYFGDVKLLISSNVTGSEPHPVPPPDSGAHPPHRAVPLPRSRSLPGGQRRTAGLDAGRLHHERRAALLAAGRREPASTTSATPSRSPSTPTTARSRFYVADPEDPIVRTYQRIFPSLFEPLDAHAGRRCASTCATRRISSSCRRRCTAPTT